MDGSSSLGNRERSSDVMVRANCGSWPNSCMCRQHLKEELNKHASDAFVEQAGMSGHCNSI
jgi:hypothetical protein